MLGSHLWLLPGLVIVLLLLLFFLHDAFNCALLAELVGSAGARSVMAGGVSSLRRSHPDLAEAGLGTIVVVVVFVVIINISVFERSESR